jgi:signal transduction histidine kinase
VHIERISADGNSYNASDGLRLPRVARDLTIDYTALSLAVPQKVRFRYKLEGQDPDWKEVVNERQVRYTNLSPGHYTFRVIACNNDGVWNETGTSLHFSIAPAYYQTAWFRLCCVVALLLLLWVAYLFRVRQLEAQFAVGLEARVDERTRIARDLHDTLLQSFNALLLRLQTVSNVLPAQPDEAKRRIDRAIEQASNAITEGRDTLNELRSTGSAAIDLDQAISNFARELLSGSASELVPDVQVQVEGTPIPMNPIVRDEVYRIATEGVRNAIRHAHARQIEVEIRYAEHQLRLRIGDNGTGIDPAILDHEHKAGHWGLRGMRERAKLVGGTLEVWSQLDVGTEIDLSIPAASVYATPPSARWFVLSRFGRS